MIYAGIRKAFMQYCCCQFINCTVYKRLRIIKERQGFAGSYTEMEDECYQSMKNTSSTRENEYELAPYVKGEIEPQPHIVSDSKSSHQSVWSIPVIILIVLMCIILLLLVTIIIMTGLILTAQDATGTGSNINSYYNSSLQSLNNNSQQQCPNLTELANVVQILNDNIQQQFPNFTQWSDDIVTGVYQYLDPSLSSLSDDDTLVLSLITQLNNTMQDIAHKVDVIGKFNEEEETLHENNTLLLDRVMETVSSSVIKLNNIIGTLSNIKDTSTSTAGVVDDILLIVQELLVQHNVSTALPTSCNQLKSQYPSSPSGYYVLTSANGSTTYTAYCNMEKLCGSGGGWTRLAYLDMSDSTQNCPSGLQYYSSAGLRTCGKKNTMGATCDSVQFSSNGISYSQVCGRVVGYQYGTPDAVHPRTQNIDSVYLDGVSITHGGSPRQHIWSLLVGVHSNKSYFDNCPCAGGSSPQSFIGNDYFCESANPTDSWDPVFYSTDPLWDGKGCDAAEAGCCSDSRLPWFNKTLNPATTDYLEMRVCVDQGTHTEDIKLTFYELYVK